MDTLSDDLLTLIFAGIPRVAAPNRRIRALIEPPVQRQWYRRMKGLREVPFAAAVNRQHLWFGIDPSDTTSWSASVDCPPQAMFAREALEGGDGECEIDALQRKQHYAHMAGRVAVGIHLNWFQTEYDPHNRALIFRVQNGAMQSLGYGIHMGSCDYGCIFVSPDNMLQLLVLNVHSSRKGGWLTGAPSKLEDEYVLIRIRMRPVDVRHIENLQAWGVV